MLNDIRLMVFTDLDGTLIDHKTYRWDAAQQALRALDDVGAGVVLASSKTAAEISELRDDLGLGQWPAIVENGAGVLPAHVTHPPDHTAYNGLRSVLAEIPGTLRDHFCGFGDQTASQVAQITGLTLQAATLAKQRSFSEPGLWDGTPEQRATFLDLLKTHGITAQQGGRFLTLSFGANKADRMREIISTYKPRHTVALGDAPNDVQMLETADFGFIVANPHSAPLPPLKGETTGRITRTKEAGPSGWNTAILDLIKRLNLRKD